MRDLEAAEALNTYFVSIHVQDDGRLPFFDKRNITTEFADDVDFSMLAINKVISMASHTHSCGPDGF